MVLDEFAGRMSQMSLTTLLSITDRWNNQLPVKGGHTWHACRRLIITSNYHPRDWYDFSTRLNQWPALIRRFTHVHWWYDWSGALRGEADSNKFYLLTPSHDWWKGFWIGPSTEGSFFDGSRHRNPELWEDYVSPNPKE